MYSNERIIHSPEYLMGSDDFYFFKSKFIAPIKEGILDKKFSIKDIKHLVSYREINNWDVQGLLNTSREKDSKGWRKFNTSDLLWLNILKKLRAYGLSIKLLKQTAKCAFPVIEEKIYEMFAFPVHHMENNHINMYAIIFPDGWLEISSWMDLNRNIAYRELNASSYITINLNQCMAEIFPERDFSYEIKIGLNEEQKEILDAVKNSDDSSEIVIFKKDDKVSYIHNKTSEKVKKRNLKELSDKIYEEASKSQYSEFTIRIDGEESIQVTKTDKKKV